LQELAEMLEAYTYKISLYFAKEGAWIKDLEVLACDLEDNDIIIGMGTITRGDLAITNKDGETWFSFRIPSQEHIEFE
jgi:rRNA pseudouridine-1189 N-methylase Emg1 (Nep1/Mra1 family)